MCGEKGYGAGTLVASLVNILLFEEVGKEGLTHLSLEPGLILMGL